MDIRTTDPHIALGGIQDHRGPLRASSLESEPFLVLASVIAQSQGDPTAGQHDGGREGATERICVSFRLLHTTPVTALDNHVVH